MDLQITVDATPEEARAELARWLDSGEYKQTNGTLCRITSGGEYHCCLGVASEIGVALGLVTKVIGSHTIAYSDETSLLPYRLREFFGMTGSGELVGYSADEYSAYATASTASTAKYIGNPELTGYNDRLEANFHEIAAVVRNGDFKSPYPPYEQES